MEDCRRSKAQPGVKLQEPSQKENASAADADFRVTRQRTQRSKCLQVLLIIKLIQVNIKSHSKFSHSRHCSRSSSM